MPLRWYVAQVKAGSEGTMESRMEGFEVFVPRVVYRRPGRYRGVMELVLPLIPGYVFVRFDKEADADRWPALNRVQSVVGLLPRTGDGDPLAVGDSAIEALRAAGREMRPHEAVKVIQQFVPGEAARLIVGPLSGYLGKVTRQRGEAVTLLIGGLLGGEIRVNARAGELEKLSGDAQDQRAPRAERSERRRPPKQNP